MENKSVYTLYVYTVLYTHPYVHGTRVEQQIYIRLLATHKYIPNNNDNNSNNNNNNNNNNL
jgi:hypothetical protein